MADRNTGIGLALVHEAFRRIGTPRRMRSRCCAKASDRPGDHRGVVIGIAAVTAVVSVVSGARQWSVRWSFLG